jgi:hypothetical protein
MRFKLGLTAGGTIQLWNLVDESLIGTLIPNKAISSRATPLAITAEGHYQASESVMNQIRYVVKTDAGQETLTSVEFYQQFGWQNNSGKVH